MKLRNHDNDSSEILHGLKKVSDVQGYHIERADSLFEPNNHMPWNSVMPWQG